MTDPGAPRPRGRHAAPAMDAGSVPSPWTTSRPQSRSGTHGPTGRRASDSHGADARAWDAEDWSAGSRNWDDDTAAWRPVRPARRRPDPLTGASTTGMRRVSGVRVSGLVDRVPGDDEDVRDPQWRHRGGSSDGPEPHTPADHRSSWGAAGGDADDRPQHPSAPLPPRPPGTWERLARRAELSDDDDTAASPLGLPPARPVDDEDVTEAHPGQPRAWEDETGGLEVIGAHVDEGSTRRGRWRRSRGADGHDDSHDGDRHAEFVHEDLVHEDLDDVGDDTELHDVLHDDDIPDAPSGRGGRRGRRRRRPLPVLIALVVFAGLVLGIVFGGQRLIDLIHPSSKDYTGPGTGSVQVRVKQGDSLSSIASTLQTADVIAGTGPFVDAADANPAAMGITSGVYQMRLHMSGQAALDLMLDPASKLTARVTIPEGLTAAATLQRIADGTHTPIEQLKAAAADPTATGLPSYAHGSLEGFLFPATYEWEPGTAPAQMLHEMVARAVRALDDLNLPDNQRLAALTEASLVQAEASSTADMAKVARVLDNRIAIGMDLQLDTTVNYANGKSGLTTTPQDRQNPSPYNTYVHAGLPPGPISNPGEDALRAVQSPTPGDWLYFVVVDPSTGDTRFAVTAAEHQQNVLLFQQWLRAHPGG